jgi:pSer/pThr/pTyr-binding forkhead associated (FHA) protein
MHRQSAYLFGRDRLVADIPVEHPSCSKQHAVFQYRCVEYTRKDGSTGRAIKPYIIDLGSTNGTFVNNNPVEAQRYFELREKDVLKFGFSSREYVLLHEESKNKLVEEDEGEMGQQEEENEVKSNVETAVVKEEKTSPTSVDKKKSKAVSSSSESSSSESDSEDEKTKRKKQKSK